MVDASAENARYQRDVVVRLLKNVGECPRDLWIKKHACVQRWLIIAWKQLICCWFIAYMFDEIDNIVVS